MKLAITLVLILGLIVSSSSAFAENNAPKNSGDPIYMNIQGITGDVNGGSCSGIMLDSFSWGLTQTGTQSSGGGGGAGKVSFHDISITKNMDKSSPLLLKLAQDGKSSPVHIDFCKRAGGKSVIYASYDLDNALISSYSVSSGGDVPTETFTLNFSKVNFSFSDYARDGSLLGTLSVLIGLLLPAV